MFESRPAFAHNTYSSTFKCVLPLDIYMNIHVGGCRDEYQEMVNAIDQNLNLDLEHDLALDRKEIRKNVRSNMYKGKSQRHQPKTYKGMPLLTSTDNNDYEDTADTKTRNAVAGISNDGNGNTSMKLLKSGSDDNEQVLDGSNSDRGKEHRHQNVPYYSDLKHYVKENNENHANSFNIIINGEGAKGSRADTHTHSNNFRSSRNPNQTPPSSHLSHTHDTSQETSLVERTSISSQLFLAIITGEGELSKWKDHPTFKKMVRSSEVSLDQFMHRFVDFDLNLEMHVL